jgi:hypothetical protein
VFRLATHPPTSWVPVVALPPNPSIKADRNGPHPSAEGRGAFVVVVRGQEHVGVVRVEVVV